MGRLPSMDASLHELLVPRISASMRVARWACRSTDLGNVPVQLFFIVIVVGTHMVRECHVAARAC